MNVGFIKKGIFNSGAQIPLIVNQTQTKSPNEANDKTFNIIKVEKAPLCSRLTEKWQNMYGDDGKNDVINQIFQLTCHARYSG